MVKRAAEREIVLDPGMKGVPLQRWLYSESREAILAGRLEPGARLPASRDLAMRLGISRGFDMLPECGGCGGFLSFWLA